MISWTFKYEPSRFEDMILNPSLRPLLAKALDEVPNLMIYGLPGTGKGTFTHILLNATEMDYIWINASDETGIDTIRTKVHNFAFSMGVTPLKIVVLNEADSLTRGAQGAQKMLKQLIEDVHSLTRFILLLNEEALIMRELRSRFIEVKLDNPPKKDIFDFCLKILESEKVKYNKMKVASIVKRCYPDIRKTILTLEENTIEGELKTDFLSTADAAYEQILNMLLASPDLDNIRKVLRSNYIDYDNLYKYLYENVGKFKSPGDMIEEIGDHLISNSHVSIKEINFMHMVIRCMKKGLI